MIYIFCALNDEANCLKPILTDDCKVVLTGVGKVNAAYTVGKIFGNRTRLECSNDYIINFGCCCGNDINKVFLANKITDIASSRDFYPDMIRFSGYDEVHLLTSDIMIRDPQDGLIYDMEASGIIASASRHISPDRMFFIKCVSDDGKGKVQIDSIITACKAGVSTVKDLIDTIHSFPVENKYKLNSVSKLHLTATMSAQLEELALYSESVGEDIDSYILNLIGDRDKLNKKESLEVIDNVVKHLLS